MGSTYQLMSSSSAMAGVLISAIWQGAVLVISVALLLRFFPKMSAAARSVIWFGVLLLLVSLHIAAAFAGGSPAAANQGFGHSAPVHIDMRWSLAIVSSWLLFSLVRVVQLLLSAASLRRIAERAIPLESKFLPERITTFRRTEICASADVERPCVAGFFSPRILLPSTLLQRLSPSDMTQIVLHEMEHLRRADDWTNLVQKISLALFPLNPALLWVERRLCVERELACDDRVLHATKARKAYAACLANLAEHSLLRRGISLALGAWERPSELTLRVHRILAGSKDAMGTRQTKAVTGVLAGGLLCGAFALAHSPALVSFTPAPRVETLAAADPVPAGEIVKAVYHQPPPAPKLVKAIVASPTSKSATLKPHRSLKPAAHSEMVAARRMSRSASWIVLTEWHESGTPSAHASFIPPAYAAVPTADGWLIIQL